MRCVHSMLSRISMLVMLKCGARVPYRFNAVTFTAIHLPRADRMHRKLPPSQPHTSVGKAHGLA